MSGSPTPKGVIGDSVSWRKHRAVVPSDTVNFDLGACSILQVTTPGTLVVVDEDFTAVSYTTFTNNEKIHCKAIRVNATGTDSGLGIIAGW